MNIGRPRRSTRRGARRLVGGRATSPTPTATGSVLAPANAQRASGEPDFLRAATSRVDVDGRGPRRSTSPASTSARTSTATSSSTPTATRSTSRTRTTRPRPPRYEGADGVAAGLAPAAGRLRPALRRPQPADLRLHRPTTRRSSTSATSSTGCRRWRRSSTPTPTRTRWSSTASITWVVDLYTTTDRYPYAQRADTDQLTSGSGLNHDFNYVRNSVKATVDAYDGTVTFYVVDDEDPIIEAYRKAFPDLFTDGDEMPDEPAGAPPLPRGPVPGPDHRLRPLPPRAIPRRSSTRTTPGASPATRARAGADPTTPVTDEQGQLTGEQRGAPHPPYYQLLQLPQDEDGTPTAEAEMVLMRPFVPVQRGRQQPAAHRLHGRPHGRRQLRRARRLRDVRRGPAARPRHRRGQHQRGRGRVGAAEPARHRWVRGAPRQPAAGADRQRRCSTSSRSTWWARAANLPLLQQVIVAYGDEVVIDETLSGALSSLFGKQAVTQEQPAATTPEDEARPTTRRRDDTAPTGTAAEQAATLLTRPTRCSPTPTQALDRAATWPSTRTRIDEARDKVEEAIEPARRRPTARATHDHHHDVPPRLPHDPPDQASWRRGERAGMVFLPHRRGVEQSGSSSGS